MPHDQIHRIHRSGWLRAAVLGANDGIVSTASLIVGVAAADASRDNILLAGVAGLVAGAMSMAAGEFVSVKTQEDVEAADLRLEAQAIEEDHEGELSELAAIYTKRGLDPQLAREVAIRLMEHDALGAHARDDIGITSELRAHPIQAAFISAGMFIAGATVPVLVVLISPMNFLLWLVPISAVVILGILGAIAASAGGASRTQGAFRVCFWGSLAISITAIAGRILGVSV